MAKNNKTKADLIAELDELREKITVLEKKAARQKKTETSLRTDLERLLNASYGWRLTFDSTESVIMLLDTDFRIERVNFAATRFFGLPFQEILGMSCSEIFCRVGLILENCPLERMKETGQYEEEEIFLSEKDVWIFATASPVKDDAGALQGAVYAFYDISQRKRTEEGLAREKYFNESLIDGLPGIFYIFDETGKFFKWNRNLELITEYSDKEVAEMTALDFFDEENKKRVAEKIQEVFVNGKSQIEAEFMTKRGVKKPYYFTGIRMAIDGKPYVMGLGIDIEDRRHAEDALRESERKFRNLSESALVGIYRTNLKGEILYANRALAEIFEYDSADEMIGTGVRKLYKNIDDRGRFLTMLKETGRVSNFELEVVTKSGRIKHVILSGVLEHDLLTGMIMDITGRKKAEEHLRISEDKFSKAFQQSPVWIVISTIDEGRYIDVNDAFLRTTGYTRDEVIGKSTLELGLWADSGDRARIVERIKRGESVRNEEISRRTKSGQTVKVLYSAERVTFNGETCLLSVSQDITNLKKAEEDLFLIKQDWEDTFNSITDMVTIHDTKFNIIRANKAAEKILGLPFLEVGKTKCFAYYHGTENPPEGCPSCDCLVTGKPALFEIFEPHLNMFIEIRAIPRFDSTGQLVGLIHVLRDITERKKAEERIREYTEGLEQKVNERTKEYEDAKLMAESSSRAKSVFLSNMSHELRTPLNTIIGFSEALISGIYGDLGLRHKEYINDILQSGMHLLTLVNGILDLSNIEAGRMELEYSDFSVKEIIGGAVYMFREKARKHMIDLRTDVDENTGTFTVDGVKIKQVLINLLANALKFTPDGGSVIVRARQADFSGDGEQSEPPASVRSRGPRGDWIEISVEDTGIGISEEDQKRLFSPFEQVHSLLEKKREGTGLGLALCRRFVELHGGSIRVESPSLLRLEPVKTLKPEEGHYKGSRFIFTLPRRPIDDTLKHKKE